MSDIAITRFLWHLGQDGFIRGQETRSFSACGVVGAVGFRGFHGFHGAVQDLQALCKPLGFSLLTAELNELKDRRSTDLLGTLEYLESQLPIRN